MNVLSNYLVLELQEVQVHETRESDLITLSAGVMSDLATLMSDLAKPRAAGRIWPRFV